METVQQGRRHCKLRLEEELGWNAEGSWTSEMAVGMDLRSPEQLPSRGSAGNWGCYIQAERVVLQKGRRSPQAASITPPEHSQMTPSALPFYHGFSQTVVNSGDTGVSWAG